MFVYLLKESCFQMPKIDIIVQARMGSSRLPSKMMSDLGGEPMLSVILKRLLQCKKICDLILAIPDTKENDILEEEANRISGVKVVRGSEHDLIQRYLKAADAFNTEQIIRFPGDNPMPDPDLIDHLVDFHINSNKDGFSSNISSVFGNDMIDGVGAEIFSVNLLKRALHNNPTQKQREHIHMNFYDYDRGISIDPEFVNVSAPPVDPTFRLNGGQTGHQHIRRFK